MTPAEVLAAYAPSAGLSASLAPFAPGEKNLPLAARLAAHPLLMAPMAGVSDAAYRMMARAGGADLAYSEMVSVAGLHYGEKSWELVDPADGEPDLAVQLFGSRPELFREAAARVAARLGERLALIDVNMACPVPKVTRKGEGSALLENPELAAQIVRACREGAPGVDVTVKIRRGRYAGQEVAPEFARAMEDAGAAAVAVHGRFATQMYHGTADWGVIDRVADAVGIPVVASGDVMSHEAALRALTETGATAVMVARGTYGNPWVFSGHVPSPAERIAAFECHVRLLEATGAHLKRARSLAGWYFKGMPDAARWRNAAMGCVTAEEFLAVADEVRAHVCA
ncbi:tRNA-dihydrouridine synthase [Olsenella profusa]|uniref:tRNA-dihydrouridine synthase n=1 Tax=Olsenella profusa TaxID=138595 RepID=A0ABS2F2R5_9ACTN|nr:tRNA-dihydrouridine synthase [Olsenella profusa]